MQKQNANEKKKVPKDVKRLIELNELFPGLTSDADRELIEKYEKKSKKNRDVESGTTLILPGNKEFYIPDNFDIETYMRESEDPVTGAIRDLKVDDRDLAHAKNFHDFSYRIIGRDANPPWARQMWTGAMLFGEVCTACTKAKYLDVANIKKSEDSEYMVEKLVMLKHGVCPRCKRHKWDLIKNFNLCDYQQLVNVLGQRSGKSSSAAMYAAYMTHQYLKFPSLGTLAKNEMQKSTLLTGTFVSLTFAKAVGVLWTPYKKLMQESSWFQEFHKLLKYSGQKLGQELYRDSAVYVDYMYKNLRFYPSGPKSSTLRGDTRIFAALDELGLFPLPKGDSEEDEQSERANADEAHKSLNNSLTTVQAIRQRLMREGVKGVPGSVLLNVSSPISQRDKMMRLLRQSRTEEGEKFLLGVNLPTWEVNPGMSRQDPKIVAAYSDNAEMAERDYGANPPSVHSQFVPRSAFEFGVFVNGQNSHNFIPQYDQPAQVYGKVQRIRDCPWPSLLTIDAGHKNNSFAIIGSHYNFDTGKSEVSTIIECMAEQGRSINFNLLYQHVILPIAKDINAVAMLADQWQSIDLLYRIEEDMGKNPLGKVRCKAQQYSPKRKDFVATNAMLTSKNLVLPTLSDADMQHVFAGNVQDYRVELKGKPIQHIMLQFSTVRDQGEMKCPTKGEGFTDDLYRALVLNVSKLHHPLMMARLTEARNWIGKGGRSNAMPMPGFAGRSGGQHRGLR